MQRQDSAPPAIGLEGMAAAVPRSDAARLNDAIQKILYYTILVGGIGVPVVAWIYVGLRGLFI